MGNKGKRVSVGSMTPHAVRIHPLDADGSRLTEEGIVLNGANHSERQGAYGVTHDVDYDTLMAWKTRMHDEGNSRLADAVVVFDDAPDEDETSADHMTGDDGTEPGALPDSTPASEPGASLEPASPGPAGVAPAESESPSRVVQGEPLPIPEPAPAPSTPPASGSTLPEG